MVGRPKGPPFVRVFDRIPADLAERIEAWRLSQPVPPTKAQTIIFLIERGLAAVTKYGT